MVFVFFFDVLYTKVIDNKDKLDVTSDMGPEAASVFAWAVAIFFKVSFQVFICKVAGLF